MVQFWKNKPLSEWSQVEWESLCDGCGKCCMFRLEDEETGNIHITNVACKLFDPTACTCTDYAQRSTKVPDCVTLTPQNIDELYWMPETCAYRLIAEGKELPEYHHLISGNTQTIHEAGMSVRDRSICETQVDEDDLAEHLVNWPGEPRRG